MEVGGEFHAAADLYPPPPRKRLCYPLNKGLGRPEPVWTVSKEKILLSLPTIQ